MRPGLPGAGSSTISQEEVGWLAGEWVLMDPKTSNAQIGALTFRFAVPDREVRARSSLSALRPPPVPPALCTPVATRWDFQPENGGMSDEPTTIQVTVVGPRAFDVSRQVRDALLTAGFVLGENGTFHGASEMTISCTSSPLLQRVSQN
ncbi:MAG: cell division protein ZipA C-terminal FtsZ-binding domain-containing protein [Gemmatimonadetes bacterium]|nr:cell division protein ZipA C-terminal FtsZ-binding domain-containing protein [Gemmatimonadota bacterium]